MSFRRTPPPPASIVADSGAAQNAAPNVATPILWDGIIAAEERITRDPADHSRLILPENGLYLVTAQLSWIGAGQAATWDLLYDEGFIALDLIDRVVTPGLNIPRLGGANLARYIAGQRCIVYARQSGAARTFTAQVQLVRVGDFTP